MTSADVQVWDGRGRGATRRSFAIRVMSEMKGLVEELAFLVDLRKLDLKLPTFFSM